MRLPVCRASPSAMSNAEKVFPLPAGPKTPILSAALSGCGLVKDGMLVSCIGMSVGNTRGLTSRPHWLGWCCCLRLRLAGELAAFRLYEPGLGALGQLSQYGAVKCGRRGLAA